MRPVTFSADEMQIEKACRIAAATHTTMNRMFRDWLDTIVETEERISRYQDFMDKAAGKVEVGGRTFSRDGMNRR